MAEERARLMRPLPVVATFKSGRRRLELDGCWVVAWHDGDERSATVARPGMSLCHLPEGAVRPRSGSPGRPLRSLPVVVRLGGDGGDEQRGRAFAFELDPDGGVRALVRTEPPRRGATKTAHAEGKEFLWTPISEVVVSPSWKPEGAR